MANLKSMHMAGGLLATLIAAAGSHDGPPLDVSYPDVLTLTSSNERIGGEFGNSVAGAGDVNQDGFADVIVGAPLEFVGAGRAYVFSGQNGSLLFELVSPNEERAGWFGYSVAGAGDLDQDGFADVIVGAPMEDTDIPVKDAGRAYAFSGKDGSLLFALLSPNEQAMAGAFGESVAGGGDVDGDGFADLFVGAASEETDDSPTSAGRAYVYSGQDGRLLLEFVSPNEETVGLFGTSIAVAGDVDLDGFADVLVGASWEDPGDSPMNAGRAYVFSGHDGSLIFELVSPNEENDGRFGTSVSGAGDVNQDGLPDVIVGAPWEDPGTSPAYAGRAYVFSGQDGGVLAELVSPNEQAIGYFGSSVASAGQVDQDGVADLIVGAPGETRAYVFSGQLETLLVELVPPNEWPISSFGWSVARAGDANHDGLPDLVVGDPEGGPQNSGRAYVFLSPGAFRINGGGPNYTDTNGSLFSADRAYAQGGFGYVGGLERRFNQPIGGTDDDPLYQDVRVARERDSDGIFAYRFDVAAAGRYDVTLYLMAPALDGAGNIVMDVQAEGDVIFDDLDVTAEAGGDFQALVKTFAVDVTDGTLDLRFRAVNKAAVVSAIAVVAQAEARAAARKR